MYKVETVHLEPTQLCQASCPMCDRNKNGGEVNQHLVNKSLTIDEVKKIFSKSFLRSLKSIYMCGNHGDPILAQDCLEMIKYFRESNPDIHLQITTNGGARKPEWWEELAQYINFVNFSVDGLEDTNHLYRQGVNWRILENNMQAFTDAGGTARWTFLVFNYNEHQVEEAKEYSQLLGVKKFIVKKSGRYINTYDLKKRKEHQAVNRKGEFTALLSQPKNPKYQNKALGHYDDIIKNYGSMDRFIEQVDLKPKCVEKAEIYVSAEGHIMPCCWLHGQMYKWWRPIEESQEYKILEQNGGYDAINALIHPIEDILVGNFFKDLQNRWGIKGIDNGRVRTCGLKCNVGFDPFSCQWE